MVAHQLCPETRLTFVALDEAADFLEYERLARAEMTEEDLVSARELREMTELGRVLSWYVFDGDERVGWCAVELDSRRHPDPSAIHMLGNIVFGDRKGRGYGSAMVAWRGKQFEDRPITAAVRPGNVASERVLTKAGFRQGLQKGPWLTWHRPSRRVSVLIRMARGYHDDPGDSVTASIYLDHVIRSLRAMGDYVVVTDDVTAPKPIAAEKGGLWPDPAAFTMVLTVNVPGMNTLS